MLESTIRTPPGYKWLRARSEALQFAMNSDVLTGSLLRALAGTKPCGSLIRHGDRSIPSGFPSDTATGSIHLLRLGDDLLRRRDACRNHHVAKRRIRFRRRFEVSKPVTNGDRQRDPSELVRTVPDVDLRSPGREKLHDFREVLVGGGMHRGLAVVVDRV